MSKPRILIVEDERQLVKTLEYNFTREGYETIVAHDGSEGLRKAQMLLPDLVLLDLMLPVMNGLDVCREIRAGEKTRGIPVIMLTARAEETDQVVGFSMGADDYVTKPFSPKVLIQRIKAQLRRRDGHAAETDELEHLGVRLDRVKYRVTVDGQAVELTPTEFRLLDCMLKQPGRAFSRQQLMNASAGDGHIVLERTIDVHVKTLRRKIGKPDLIETVRGIGYRFKEAQPVS
jgi:two-component system phosphate regulon response regulator PhoB